MDLSVEISTYNRKDVLKTVLTQLAQQTYPASRFEVVVSDDGSSDGLTDMVAAMAADLPYSMRILRNPRTGVGHTHNLGITACQADLVLMLAGDIIPVPQLIEQHVATHRQHPAPHVVVAGRIRQSPELPDTVFQQAFGKLVEQIFAHEMTEHHVTNFLVSNLSFKRQFMLDYGLFREWPYAAGEDIELGYRLKQHGMQVIDNALALGYHFHEVTLESVAFRAYSSGYYSHLLAEHVADPEFRRRFEHRDRTLGIWDSLRIRLKRGVRDVLFNRYTVPTLVIPPIHWSERLRFLAPVVPSLCRRMASYYYAKGLRDHRRQVPFDPLRGRIYPTDGT